ncbi:hypothetical protein G9274_002773 [Stenotrophomonas rhizophila]|nr:hypothetical protein G9274_002773 [Stenotrophomonas rhizophila]
MFVSHTTTFQALYLSDVPMSILIAFRISDALYYPTLRLQRPHRQDAHHHYLTWILWMAKSPP